jgi:sulfide:quinone oxidoreductase
VHITELPIKCPVAPLEFAFLADDHFRRLGIRDRVEMIFVTPLSGAFTKPIASDRLGDMLEERGILVESDFYVERVDPGALVSYDERVVPFDLLVTVPLNMGADFVAKSGLGDELNHVRVDPHTFLVDGCENVFALGDAAALPISKAGSVAHFAVEVFVENFLQHIAGRPMERAFDGHANCFVESGGGKALLIDFNYDTEPLPGAYPLPVVGPLSLLKETRVNHLGKLAFRPIYWHMLLPGRRLPVPTAMSMAGKQVPTGQPEREDVTI